MELGDITLICLYLFGSTRRRGTNVKGEHHGLLAAKIPKLHDVTVLVGQGKVRGAIAHFQIRGAGKQGHKENAQKEAARDFSFTTHLRNPEGGTPGLPPSFCFMLPYASGLRLFVFQ